jgi:RNA polymerase sigma-70 factor (ECF subfamily)
MDHAEQSLVSVPGEFERFYADHYTAVVALTTALAGSRWVGEDLAQEAFLRAHRDWLRVRQLEAPLAWVRRIAINLSHSRYRRLRAEASAHLRLRGRAHDNTSMEPRDEAFWEEVRRLPNRQAQAVALRYVDELSTAEIAHIMGTAEGTVRALLTQGRARLARQLAAKGWIER